MLTQKSAPGVCATDGSVAPEIVHASLRAPAQSLDGPTREGMERHFGRDFGHVRVHADPLAAESAQAVQALAYTVGNDIVFARGRYAPSTSWGQRLIAHELAHVAQQDGAGSHASAGSILVDDSREAAANAAAGDVASAKVQRTGGNRAVQRPVAGRRLLRAVDRDIRTTQVTPDWAQQLTEAELRGQIDLAQGLLLGMAPDDPAYAGLQENLTALEAEASRRFTPQPAASATSSTGSPPRSSPSVNPAVAAAGGLVVAGVVGTGTGTAGGLSTAAASGALGTATELGVVADTVWVGGTAIGTGTLTTGTGAVVGGTIVAEGTAVAGGAVIAGGAEVVAVTGATVLATEAGTGLAAATAAAAGSSVVPVVGWIVAGLIVGGIVIYLVTRDSTPRQAPGASGNAPVSEPSAPPPVVAPPVSGQAPATDPGPRTPVSAPGATNGAETLQAGRRPADLPSWSNVTVNWDHIYDGHWDGTPLAPSAPPRRVGNNDMFNGLSKDAIDALIRAAYSAVDQKLATQGDRIRVRGRAGIWTVEFWVNKATREVETAYPIFP